MVHSILIYVYYHWVTYAITLYVAQNPSFFIGVWYPYQAQYMTAKQSIEGEKMCFRLEMTTGNSPFKDDNREFPIGGCLIIPVPVPAKTHGEYFPPILCPHGELIPAGSRPR